MQTQVAGTYVERVDGDLPFKLLGAMSATCFVAALVTDIVYTRSPEFLWTTFSIWAITIGLFLAGFAALAGLIDRAVHHRFNTFAGQWPYVLGFAVVVIVEIFNAFVHSRDAYESVVPEGIALSAIAVALLVLTAIVGRSYTRTRLRKAP